MSIPCNLCQRTDAVFYLKGRDVSLEGAKEYMLVKCPCGLIFQDPQPSLDEQALFYPDEYAPYANANPYEWSPPMQWLKRLKELFFIVRYPPVSVTYEDKKVLDFGCGGGRFMGILKVRHPNWEVWGYDVGSNRVPVENMINGTYADLLTRFEPGYFDSIYLGNVLEHLMNPVEDLRMLYTLLKEGGEIHIDVPNIASHKSIWFGKNFSGLDLPRHLYHFTPITLRETVEKAGFFITSLTASGNPKSLIRSIYYACGIYTERLSGVAIFLSTKFFPKRWDDEELNLIAIK